jgi:hypothetical protein
MAPPFPFPEEGYLFGGGGIKVEVNAWISCYAFIESSL